MLALPESPRWLAGHGHLADARRALQALRGSSETARQIEAELDKIEADLAGEERGAGRVSLADPSLRLPLVVGVGLAIFQQVTGINTVIYFAPTIFQAAGLSSASASILATAGVGAVNVALTLVAIRLIDRVGRRVLLLVGLAGMAASLVVLGAGFLLGAGGALGWLTAASLTAYVGFFAVGLGPVFWLLISEIFPTAARGRCMSIATVANWGFNLLVALTFLNLVEAFGRPATFFLYAALTGMAFLFTLRLVPETRGRGLEDMREAWAERGQAVPQASNRA